MRASSGAAVAVTLAAAATLAATSGASAPPEVVARDAAGRVVASLPLDGAGGFGLAYRHSTERAPAEERFRARRDGTGFELRSIRTTDPGVLDYYEVAGRRRRLGHEWELVLARPVPFRALALAASVHGRRTLVTERARTPLHPRGRGTAHVTLRVEAGGR